MIMDKSQANRQDNEYNSLDNIQANSLAISQDSPDTINWLSMKDAAVFIGKSHPMIKLLVAEKKVKSTRVKGKYGFEVRVDADDLVRHYKELDSQYNNSDNKKEVNFVIPDNIQASQDNDKTVTSDYIKSLDIHKEALEKILVAKNDQIKNLEKQNDNLQEEIVSKRLEQERILKLFENQQSLMLSLQQQMKTLTNAVTPTDFSTQRGDQNTNQEEGYITEVKASSKPKKWWFF